MAIFHGTIEEVRAGENNKEVTRSALAQIPWSRRASLKRRYLSRDKELGSEPCSGMEKGRQREQEV